MTSGVDWWDVLSLMIEPDLRQLMLISRLARELEAGCELHASRPSRLAKALQTMIGAKTVKVKAGFRPVRQWARHYRDVFSRLDMAQISQVFQDKFDREHMVRRRFAPTARGHGASRGAVAIGIHKCFAHGGFVCGAAAG